MIVIIDGDNSPGTNVRKLGRLDERDKVIIYYASDNGYFAKESNRISLIEGTRCHVGFKCVPAGNCAVDLAVAMDAGIMLQNSPADVLVFISKDKHFKIIQNLIKSSSCSWYVAQASDVEEAVQNYKVLETSSLDEFQNWLIHLFGIDKGIEMYERIDLMFTKKHAEFPDKLGKREKCHGAKERLFIKCLSDIMHACNSLK